MLRQEGHCRDLGRTAEEERAAGAVCQRRLEDAEQVALRVTKALEDTRKECSELRRQAGEVGVSLQAGRANM